MRTFITLLVVILVCSYHQTTAQTCSGTVANVTANTPSQTVTTATCTVPAGGPYLVKITAAGAKGGANAFSQAGGNGATMQGTFVVSAGQTLNITAGAPGATGYAGGGGGGSGVYIQNGALQNILLKL